MLLQKCLVRPALETINKERTSYQNRRTSPEKKNRKCMVLKGQKRHPFGKAFSDAETGIKGTSV